MGDVWASRRQGIMPGAAGRIACAGRLIPPRSTEIRRVHTAHRGRYGAPRIHTTLRTGAGMARQGSIQLCAPGPVWRAKNPCNFARRRACGKPRVHAALRVERRMRQHGIRAKTPRRVLVWTTYSHHNLPIAPNRLDRNFAVERPNQVWLGRHHLCANRCRLALPGGRARSLHQEDYWLGDAWPHAGELTIAALTMAIQRQKPHPGLVHHSDRGSQYAAAEYRKVLDAAGMIQSMRRKANC